MLRQLYMTLNFYQVNHSFPLFNTSQINHSRNFQSSIIPNVNSSTFILFPYIVPKSPYPTPPSSIAKLTRYVRNESIYNDLKNLSSQQIKEFLLSYQAFKHQRFGTHNPTDIINPFYEWVIKYNLSAWDIQRNIVDHSHNIDNRDTKPIWCHARMGQSRTVLPDGRTILIGGEFEDSYDPNFCIYNDVTVIHPSGDIKAYNYPKSIFVPTDFHTATLVGSGDNQYIIIIGSLGYPEDRQYSYTTVYRLNTHNFKIEQVAIRNSMGWVHGHKAVLKDNQIIVTGGQVLIDDTAPLLDNIDTWVLNLNTLIWKNMSNLAQKWQRFYVKRQDNNYLSLWQYGQLEYAVEASNLKQMKHYSNIIEGLINKAPDLNSYRQLLIPPIDHEVISTVDGSNEGNSYDVTLYIDGIKVGYKTKDDSCIQVVIEGKLSENKLELLQQNLRHKLEKVENMACEIIDI